MTPRRDENAGKIWGYQLEEGAGFFPKFQRVNSAEIGEEKESRGVGGTTKLVPPGGGGGDQIGKDYAGPRLNAKIGEKGALVTLTAAEGWAPRDSNEKGLFLFSKQSGSRWRGGGKRKEGDLSQRNDG